MFKVGNKVQLKQKYNPNGYMKEQFLAHENIKYGKTYIVKELNDDPRYHDYFRLVNEAASPDEYWLWMQHFEIAVSCGFSFNVEDF